MFWRGGACFACVCAAEYEFPSRDKPIADVLLHVGAHHQEVLAEAFTVPAASHTDLAAAAWPRRGRPEIRPDLSGSNSRRTDSPPLAVSPTQPW